MDSFLKLSGEVVKKSSEDAGTARYEFLTGGPDAFRRIREAAAKLLEE